MNTMVSIPNTKAWIRPMKNSNNRMADGANHGTIEPIRNSSTAPAKILPNNLKANERIFENSEINSRRDTARSMAPKNGFLNMVVVLKNLLK